MTRRLSSDTVRLSIAEATTLGEQTLRSIGFTADEAQCITAHLVDAACCGYPFAGLSRILEFAHDPRIKEPRQPLRVVRETPVSMLVDGGNNIGYCALYHAARMAAEKAKQSGIALVGLHNSAAYSGRAAYYLELIVRENLVGILFSSALPSVAPEGGARRMLGTNPLAIALPTGGEPMIFDMGTAAITQGELVLRARLNEELPEGVAIDENGLPTLDPHEAMKGSILPFGGRDRHKGFGLSLSIQALSLLAGASLPRGDVQDSGQLFIVFDPGLLIPEAQFKRDIDELIARIKASPRRPGSDEIRIPSERSFRERERAKKEGILVERKILDALSALRAPR